MRGGQDPTRPIRHVIVAVAGVALLVAWKRHTDGAKHPKHDAITSEASGTTTREGNPLQPDAYMHLSRASSPLMVVLIGGVNTLAAVLPMTWVRRYVFPRLRRTERGLAATRLITDCYLVGILTIEFAALMTVHPNASWIYPAIALYGLLESTSGHTAGSVD